MSTVLLCWARVLQLAADAESEPAAVLDVRQLLRSRLAAAVQLRRALRLPSDSTNVYRLCNRCASTFWLSLQNRDLVMATATQDGRKGAYDLTARTATSLCVGCKLARRGTSAS